MTLAIDDQTPGAKKGGSLLLTGAVLLVLTAGAAGGGWFLGNMLGAEAGEARASAAEAAANAESGEFESALALYPMPVMSTGLAAPSDVWVRLEATLLFDEAVDELVGEQVHQDVFAFLRTVKPHQIEGASGYRHFKTDLEDIARIRSEGKVKGVLIRTLMFE
ncbi:flagellar basal body protein FliL [Aliihoeflea aestuarii]|uniref:flagellar basal body protein FliL n=1 Tax=Aliihoeflea aestuarii TaxID=453840 RepID=UPI0020947773|nr:flagellar basal body protein FliL [Aliihoeflea aestuarii]MCO6392890.1 flagellar basal body protein FliL [Aliihoeflea aestuarii]